MTNKEIKIIPVIRIATEIGKGTHEDPFRLGFEYWDTKNNLLFVCDADENSNTTYVQSK